MRIIIAGGHGKIALHLERLLSARGDTPVGMVRNPDHVGDLEAAGAEAVVLDLEKASVDQVAEQLGGADAVVFAAGAGPGSGAERKWTVDRDAAILLADAADVAGVKRYLMVSSINADAHAEHENAVFQTYLRAKGEADEAIRGRRSLEWTIIQPGRLTDDPGTGRIKIAEARESGTIPREDVASVLVHVLDTPSTAGQTFPILSGDTPIDEAIAGRVKGEE